MSKIINKNTGKTLVEKNSEKQELYCHNCEKYVQFPIDLSLNGNHVLNCPNCNHEHCRVVENGRITSARWSQRNGTGYHYIPAYCTSATLTTASMITWSSSAANYGTYLAAW